MIWTATNLTTSSGCGSCQPAATPTPTIPPICGGICDSLAASSAIYAFKWQPKAANSKR